MPRCLNLALAGALACFVVGCATQSKPTLTSWATHSKGAHHCLHDSTREEAGLTTQSAPIFPVGTS